MGEASNVIMVMIVALSIQAFIVSAAVQIFYDGRRRRMVIYATLFVAFMLLFISISVSLSNQPRPIYAICVDTPATAPGGDKE